MRRQPNPPGRSTSFKLQAGRKSLGNANKQETLTDSIQCLSTKQVGQHPNARHRAILSASRKTRKLLGSRTNADGRILTTQDSETFIQSMFSTSLNESVENGEIPKNCLIKMTAYSVNNVKDRV